MKRIRQMTLVLMFFGTVAFSIVNKKNINNKSDNGIELIIKAEKDTLSALSKEYPKINVSLKNAGNQTIYLVQPGDGSTDGWRTPRISWSVKILEISSESLDSYSYEHADNFSKIRFGGRMRCGNVNGLKKHEIIVLNPYDEVQLRWTEFPDIPNTPGKYSVKFYYENVPDIKWQGFGHNDPDALEIIKTKTKKIQLISNELIIIVTE